MQLLATANGKPGAGEAPETLAQIFSLITSVIKLRGLINSPENASLITKQHQLTEAQVCWALGWMKSPSLSYLSQLPAWALQAAPKGPGEGKATHAVLASLTFMRGRGNPVKCWATTPLMEHALTWSYSVITNPSLRHGCVCWGNLLQNPGPTGNHVEAHEKMPSEG